ncbi:restriction endonuclease subunit S [Streptomyces sp. NPDC047880]|uniref:restriction endonuclease subunit S n=1 Tax=Streptomyces sp. NPDC047880 TaxID=3155626 RepID=UPI003454455C
MSESSGVDGERELPTGWAWAELGDLLHRIEAGKSFTCEPRPALPDEWGVIKVSAMTWGSFDPDENKAVPAGRDINPAYEISLGDLLVSRANTKAYVGAPVLVGASRPKLLLSDKSLRLIPSGCVSKRWLVHFLRSPEARAYVEAKASGTKDAMRNLSQDALRRMPVALPPLAEQHRIVEALEEQLSRLDAARANVRKVMQRTDALLGRVTDFTAELSIGADDPVAPSPGAADSIDGKLPRIPVDWRWMRLGELADVVGGVTKDKKKQSDPELPEVPYLRVANVQRGHLDLEQVANIRVPPKKAEQLRLQDGDVLMNEGGDRDKLGRGWVWREQIPNAIHQNHVFRARIRHGVLIPELLSWYANGAAKWFEGNGKQSTNLASISLSKIKNLPVPVPPQSEQRRLAERIEERLIQLRHARAATERALLQAAKLRNALLRKAFRGDLVPQNEADEPAATTLARIAVERAAQPKRPRRTTTKAPPQRVAESVGPAPEPTPIPALAVQQEFDL